MEGDDIPPALQNKPELWAENQEYMNGFNDLSNRRQSGMSGAQPILNSEILSYCLIHEIEETAIFYKMISRADSAFMEWTRKKSKNGS